MLKYKLTNQDNKTFNNTLWGENITHTAPGTGELCSDGWIHYYHSPEMAVIMNPLHACIENPKLWECEAEGNHKDDCGVKGGCTKLTTLKEIPLPEITLKQKLDFVNLCSKEVNKNQYERIHTITDLKSVDVAWWACNNAHSFYDKNNTIFDDKDHSVAYYVAVTVDFAASLLDAAACNIDFQLILNRALER